MVLGQVEGTPSSVTKVVGKKLYTNHRGPEAQPGTGNSGSTWYDGVMQAKLLSTLAGESVDDAKPRMDKLVKVAGVNSTEPLQVSTPTTLFLLMIDRSFLVRHRIG
jgi:hypothetical protein